jgi:hypothetical protein
LAGTVLQMPQTSVRAMAQPLTYDCNDDKQMQVLGQMATAEQLYAECLYVQS